MTLANPLLSIVMPAFNAEEFIFEALDSVRTQESSLPFELIVVDDGSIDRTAELVFQLAKQDPRIRLIRSANGGPGSARNIGVEAAEGEIIVFMDADDKMLPGRLQHQGEFMLEHPEVSVTFGEMIVQGSSNSPIEMWKMPMAEADEFVEITNPFNRFLADGCYVCNSASGVRRDDFLVMGMQRSDIWVAEDLDLWCRLASTGHRFFLTHRQYTWVRRSCHDNLMTSSHAYRGPTIVFAEQLRAHGDRLTSEERDRAQLQLDYRANMYLRYLWAFDRVNLDSSIDEIDDVVSSKIINRWIMAKVIPDWVGRGMRRIKKVFLR